MSELDLDCPFCGGEARRFVNSMSGEMTMVRCHQCGASAFHIKWNRRATQATATQPVGEGWDDTRIASLEIVPDYPDPTPEMLVNPVFLAIWNAIKGWDMRREGGGGYHGPTGNDVRHIFDALATQATATQETT